MEASQRRDAGAVEVGTEGVGGGQPGQRSQDEAARRMSEIDEEEAILRARSGDKSLMDELNACYTQLGMPTVNVPG